MATVAANGAAVQCDRRNAHKILVTIRQQKWLEFDSSPQSTAEVEKGLHSRSVQGQL